MNAGIDDRELDPGTAPAPPAVPHTLTGIGGEDSIALHWRQDGAVDFWTVYIDPLDGSPSAAYHVTKPRFEITDLPVGDHEIGVVSWRDGVPCPGPGVFMMVTVLGAPAGGPAQPAGIDLDVTATSISASWPAGDATGWDARLIAEDWTVEQRVDGLPSPWVSFTQLQPDAIYGVQVRARGTNSSVSRWSVTAWQRPGKSLVDSSITDPQVQ